MSGGLESAQSTKITDRTATRMRNEIARHGRSGGRPGLPKTVSRGRFFRD